MRYSNSTWVRIKKGKKTTDFFENPTLLYLVKWDLSFSLPYFYTYSGCDTITFVKKIHFNMTQRFFPVHKGADCLIDRLWSKFPVIEAFKIETDSFEHNSISNMKKIWPPLTCFTLRLGNCCSIPFYTVTFFTSPITTR